MPRRRASRSSVLPASGRLLTILTDQPLLFVGAGAPAAKAKEGYDFAVIDIEVDAKGNGSGTLAPAAKIRVNESAFVVEDYASEVVRLTAVSKTNSGFSASRGPS